MFLFEGQILFIASGLFLLISAFFDMHAMFTYEKARQLIETLTNTDRFKE